MFSTGTPSLANPSTVEVILDTVSKHTDLNCDAEVTLEANPTSVQTETLRYCDFLAPVSTLLS